jgi:hypothetical protein
MVAPCDAIMAKIGNPDKTFLNRVPMRANA